jgi:hypothetical protein
MPLFRKGIKPCLQKAVDVAVYLKVRRFSQDRICLLISEGVLVSHCLRKLPIQEHRDLDVWVWNHIA